MHGAHARLLQLHQMPRNCNGTNMQHKQATQSNPANQNRALLHDTNDTNETGNHALTCAVQCTTHKTKNITSTAVYTCNFGHRVHLSACRRLYASAPVHDCRKGLVERTTQLCSCTGCTLVDSSSQIYPMVSSCSMLLLGSAHCGCVDVQHVISTHMWVFVRQAA